MGQRILWIGALMGIVSLAMGYIEWRMDPDGPWQTMIFTTLTLAQMGNALAIRSNNDSLLAIGIFSNRLMVLAVAITFALQMALIYVPFLQRILQHHRALRRRATDQPGCQFANLFRRGVLKVVGAKARGRGGDHANLESHTMDVTT